MFHLARALPDGSIYQSLSLLFWKKLPLALALISSFSGIEYLNWK